MHEFSLMADLMKKINLIAKEHDTSKVSKIYVKLGALCHISGEHFREHFEQASLGTPSEGAILDIEETTDINEPDAQNILLKSVEIEEYID